MQIRRVLFVQDVVEKLETLANANNSNCSLVTWCNDDVILVTGCLNSKKGSKSDSLPTASDYIPRGFVIGGQFGHSDSSDFELCATLNDEKRLVVNLNGNIVEHEQIPCAEAQEFLTSKTIPFIISGVVTTTAKVADGSLTIESESLFGESLAFLLEDKNTILHRASEFDTCLCKSLLEKSKSGRTDCSSFLSNTIKCKILTNACSGVKFAPVIEHVENDKFINFPLCFEVLCYVSQELPLNKLYEQLKDGLQSHTNNLKCCLNREYSAKQKNLGLPRLLYFQPPGWCHPVTICYPANKTDSDLEDFRKNVLHHTFMAKCTRPHFRRNNAIELIPKHSTLLLNNTHVGLPTPKITDGKLYLVKGKYGYHHYMQDHMDDNGWGCAYRSLQTVVSWFRNQAYTDKKIPTHKEIQQILVDTGDKTKEFVGTRKWIGSIEVSTILNQYLGVTSKIMSVGQGSELSNRGRELAMHFANQGTPIMIGGGVLAHTILGVCFSDTSGETKFLILDPHYTGGEDIKVIQDKGWCGWKGQNFWNQTAFYNLCLPQVPEIC